MEKWERKYFIRLVVVPSVIVLAGFIYANLKYPLF